MALDTAQGAFNISTGAAGTTQTVSGLAFFPEVILFQIVGQTASVDSYGTTDIVRSMGMTMKTDSTIKRCCIAGFAQNAAVPTNTKSGHRNDAVIGVIKSDGTWNGLLDIDDQGATSFRVIIDQQFAAGYRLFWWAYGGSDITALDLIEVTEPVTAGAVAVPSGFRCDNLIIMSAYAQGAAPQLSSTLGLSFGFMARRKYNGTEQAVISSCSQTGQVLTNAAMYQNNLQCAAMIAASAEAVESRVKLHTWNLDRVMLNFQEVNGNGTRRYYVLCSQGARWSVKKFTTVGDTVTDIDVTGAGFTPIGGVYACISGDTADDTIDGGFGRFNAGWLSSALTQGVQGYRDQTNQAAAVCRTAIEHDECAMNMSGTAVNLLMHATSFLADGIRHRMSIAGVQDGHVLMMASGTPWAFPDNSLAIGINK